MAVVLHPHPDFGGDRFHPFVDGLFRRLPDVGVSAVRFDFSSGRLDVARAEVVKAIDLGAGQWPGCPVVLAGYSFGAAVAAGIDDERIAGWYLLAPPLALMADAVIGPDPRPKAVVVPEHDQYSPPAEVAAYTDKWAATSVSIAPGVDHFLGDVGPLVDAALNWIAGA